MPTKNKHSHVPTAPKTPTTPPTTPVTVKRIKLMYSSTDQALEEFNKERESDTLAHWSKKEPIPQLIAVTGGWGCYKVYLGKKKSFILIDVVFDHDFNIKKEILLSIHCLYA